MRNVSISALFSTTKRALMVLVAVAVLAACGGSGATALSDTAWKLESLTGDAVLPGTSITLKFSGDQVSGSAGCNQYGGSYRARGDTLSVSDVFSTEIGCLEPPGILEQETAYLTALRTASTYQIAADRLQMLDEAGTQILVFVAATGDPTPVPQASETPVTSQEPETVEKLAPIDSVEILVAESFPPQVYVLVESGLPNGCAEFDRYEVIRDGDTIQIAVFNLEPVGGACEDEYGTVENTIPLGSDFDPGTTYTVQVNAVSETFVAQGEAPPLGQVAATLGSPFQLKVGQSGVVGDKGPIVEFMEVVEDSRCPTGADCVWEGRARILIRASSSGDVLGFGIRVLTLEAGQVNPDSDSVRGVSDTYLFELIALDPYPQVTDQVTKVEQPSYTATLVVSKVTVDPTPTPTGTAPCTMPDGWYEHTVVRGDTLFNIARRSGSSVDELAAVNCLADPTQIYVGQTLYVPNPISDTEAPTDRVQLYLIIPDDSGQSGPLVGCGDSGVAVWRDRARTGSLAGDIQASLEELFSIKTLAYGQSGYVHSLHDADLIVQRVTVEQGTAVIELAGSLQLVGTCADARMEAQVLLTVFQYPGFDSALITVNGASLKRLFDLSGTVTADEPYRRSEVQNTG